MRPGVENDVAFRVDHDVGRRVAVEHAQLDVLSQALDRRELVAAASEVGSEGGSDAAHQQRQPQRASRIVPRLEEALLLVDRREEVRKLSDVLRRAEKQETVRPQRVMEQRNDVPLKIVRKIYEEVAARDEVHPRERRIPNEAVGREHAEFADILGDDEGRALLDEKAASPLRGHGLQQRFGVAGRARHIE